MSASASQAGRTTGIGSNIFYVAPRTGTQLTVTAAVHRIPATGGQFTPRSPGVSKYTV